MTTIEELEKRFAATTDIPEAHLVEALATTNGIAGDAIAALRGVRNEALEEAVRVCKDMAFTEFNQQRHKRTDRAMDACADALRALITKPPTSEGG